MIPSATTIATGSSAIKMFSRMLLIGFGFSNQVSTSQQSEDPIDDISLSFENAEVQSSE